MPSNYSDAYKVIKPYLVDLVCFHCCPRDCVLFRNHDDGRKYSNLEFCPDCASPRFCGQRLPRKRFLYLPVGPRFAQLYGSALLAQVVQASPKQSGNYVDNIQHSPMWDNVSEDVSTRLQLSIDGMNPFNKNKTTYSMWPVTLAILNLPRQIRYLVESVIMIGINPGNGKKECYSCQPYLELLVDELLALNGTTCREKRHSHLNVKYFPTYWIIQA